MVERSGQKSWTHWRYSCPKFLRQTFVEWAGQSIRYSFWAKAYYQQQIAKGKPHNTVIRSLAFKWIRNAFRCWKDYKPYDESKYLEALKRRSSPLLAFAANSPFFYGLNTGGASNIAGSCLGKVSPVKPFSCREAFGSPEFPGYPLEQMTRSQTPVVTPTLAILTSRWSLLPSRISTLSAIH